MLIARLIRDMELDPFIPPNSETTSLYLVLYFPLIFFKSALLVSFMLKNLTQTDKVFVYLIPFLKNVRPLYSVSKSVLPITSRKDSVWTV